MEKQFLIAGFGGQGVLLIGQLIAKAAMRQGYEVSWMPSYGPEMRGGEANCAVVVSDEPIGSPLVSEPPVLVAMNKPSLIKFMPMMPAGGTLAVPCEYDEVYYFGLATIYRYVNNGYVCVEKDGKVGFVDTDGQVTCELKYGAAGVTQHGCSLTVTDLDGSIYIVAADGTQTQTDFDEVDEYSGGDGSLLVVCKDDAYGLVDWHGNEVLPLEYASYDISITDYADAVIVDDTLMVR